jgi:tetratricopeptide (TPR) repeat protein
MTARTEPPTRRSAAWIALALVAGVWAIYGQTLGFEFIKFDDDQYVSENPVVGRGLTREGLVFAFSRGELQQGHPPHPLTWLSHMLDVELFGLRAGGHHAVNAALHALASLLLFLVLDALTGARWPSAAAAAFWAWHPLRVESVAWVAERKDVLSGVFAMLTLYAYTAWARRGSRGAWWAALGCFALGLLSKPTLVPLPFALLLLDYWPLARLRPLLPRLLEKAPLFALSAASSLLTLEFHRGFTHSTDLVAPLQRVATGVFALATYLEKTLWPRDLALMYPHPYIPATGGRPLAAASIAVAAASLAVLGWALWRARRPYLTVGALWFLGMLLPMIGIVQVGRHALADRYTYLPSIGVAVGLAWGGAELLGRTRAGWLRRGLLAGVAVALAGLAATAWVQARHWRDSETLFRHTLRLSPRASVIHYDLGGWLRMHERFDEALIHYRAALASDPDYAYTHFDLGRTLHALGRVAEAIEAYQAAARLDPQEVEFRYQLGLTYELEGRWDEAAASYRAAAQLDPGDPKPRVRLAAVEAKRRARPQGSR